MSVKVLVPPATEPITLQEAKEHLRVVFDDEDVYISALITAARQMAENYLRRALAPQTLQAGFDSWDGIRIPRPPLIEVLSVSYIDTDGSPQTLADDAYTVNDFQEPAAITGPYGASLPAARAVTITYRAGYTEGVPASIIAWMWLMVGSMYANREALVNGISVNPLPAEYIDWHLQPHRVYE